MNNRNLSQPILSNILRTLIEENQDFCQQLKMLAEFNLDDLSKRIKEKKPLSNIDDLNDNIQTLLVWLEKNEICNKKLLAYLLKLTSFDALKSMDKNNKPNKKWFLKNQQKLLENVNSLDFEKMVSENHMELYLKDHPDDQISKILYVTGIFGKIIAVYSLYGLLAAALINGCFENIVNPSLIRTTFIIACISALVSVFATATVANSSLPYRKNFLQNQLKFFSPINEKLPASTETKLNERLQNSPRQHHPRSNSI